MTQFLRDQASDSEEVVTPLMLDGTYLSRNFATLGPTFWQPPCEKKKRNESWLPSDPRNLSVRRLSLSSFSFSGITLIHQGFIFLMKWIKEEKEKYAWKQWSIQANIKINDKGFNRRLMSRDWIHLVFLFSCSSISSLWTSGESKVMSWARLPTTAYHWGFIR